MMRPKYIQIHEGTPIVLRFVYRVIEDFVHWHYPDIRQRYINLAAVANFGILVLASWESFAVSFQFALANGGPASMFYGSILAGLGCCATGLSLGELAAM